MAKSRCTSCISREKKFQLGNLSHWLVPRHTESESHCTSNTFCSDNMEDKIQMPYIERHLNGYLTLTKEKQA